MMIQVQSLGDFNVSGNKKSNSYLLILMKKMLYMVSLVYWYTVDARNNTVTQTASW